MVIHKEGRQILIVTFLLLVVLNLGINFFAASRILLILTITISVIIFLLVLQFFRSPTRKIPFNPLHVIAPADGKVVVIEKTLETEYFKEEKLQVSIFMSPTNVHVNRSPIDGLIKYFKYHPGKYLVAWHPKSSTENERTTVVIQSATGVEILLRQIAGFVARRIVWYVKEGEVIKQGDEFGFIKFGSRVDIFLPIDTKVCVNLGDKTRGGQTVIAELPSIS